MGMDSPLQWEPASVNGNGEIRYLRGSRRGPDLWRRPAAEDGKAFRTNPEWISALQFTSLLSFNWLVFPAAAKTSGMEGRGANEDSAMFDIKTTNVSDEKRQTDKILSVCGRFFFRCCCSDCGAFTAPCWGRMDCLHGSV